MTNGKNSEMTISEFSAACCAGVKNPYFNGEAVDVLHISYVPDNNGIGVVYFRTDKNPHCQNAKTNEFEIK